MRKGPDTPPSWKQISKARRPSVGKRRGEWIRISDVVGIEQIAERLGVEPGTVHKWKQRFPDFPKPFLIVGRKFKREVRLYKAPSTV